MLSKVSKKILVVDDREVLRSLYRMTLEERGCYVLDAGNGREGLEKLSREKDVDLVFLSIDKPGLDGVKFMEGLSGSEEFSHIPVVACSPKGSQRDVLKCISLGATGYLSRPFSWSNFMTMIDESLADGRREEEFPSARVA